MTGEERRRLESALQRGAEDLARLQKRKTKTQQELGKEEGKLNNSKFVDDAIAPTRRLRSSC